MNATYLHDLLDRLSRLVSASDWGDGLNPAQRNALTFLSRANRFSRSPSHVADFLCTTRGTASQTLKSLERKGFVAAIPSQKDRRSISFELTETGGDLAGRKSDLSALLGGMTDETKAGLQTQLETLIWDLLQKRGHRSFGLCRTCKHHQARDKGGYCALLKVGLEPEEAELICHEHKRAAA